MTRVWVRAMWVALVVFSLVSAAEARPKKRKGKGKVPTSDHIAIAMKKQGIKWGMDKGDVANELFKTIKARYKPLIHGTHDPVEEDRLRHEAKGKMKAIKDSYVEFDGRTTGWDVSFLRDEFTHNNDESMLVFRDGNSQNFFFFINGRLWKWYKAFDSAAFPAGSFGRFAGAVQRKFGEARVAEGELAPGAGKVRWLEWQDGKTRLRAVDETEFYGFYCLVFDEKGTVSRLAELRRNVDRREKAGHSIVDSVTSGHTEDHDNASNVVDRITGKYRVREQAPKESAKSSGSSRSKRGRSGSDSGSNSGSSVIDDDDPLKGL